jgi:Viral BACON domain/Flagellar-associated PapD-like
METKRCAYCHKLLRADAQVCSRCGHAFAPKKARVLTRGLTKPSIPPASPHLAGHYSGLHPEDQPYQSSQMRIMRPAPSDAALLHRPEQEPEHIELPVFEPETDPELDRPTVLSVRQEKRPALKVAQRSKPRQSAAAVRISSTALTITCLFFLLASSTLAFVLIGNHTLIATAAFSASPNAVGPGDTFTLSGSGFKAESLLHFSFDNSQPLYDSAGKILIAHTDEHGGFALQVLVPASWAVGPHMLYASDPTQGVSISTGITVEPPSIAPPELQISSGTFKFAAAAAGVTSSQTLTLKNAGGDAVSWQASSNQPWLSASPSNGKFSKSESVQVQVNRGSLTPHLYTAQLLLTQQGGSTLTVNVSMEVSPAPAVLTVGQTALAFAGSAAGDPAPQPLLIQNSGGQPLDWSSTVTTGNGSAWLSIYPSEGHLDPGTNESLFVSATTRQLAVGPYQGTISFTGGANAQVTISLDVQAPGNLVLSPPSLNLSMLTSQQTTTKTLSIQNSGGQPLDWSATTTNGGKWLSVSPTNGTLAPGEQVSLTIKVAMPLAPGAYQGSLNFVTQGQAPVFAVSCTVTAPPIHMQSSSLNFSTTKGVNPAAQSLVMSNTSNTALNWTVNLDNTAPAFLTISPLSGTIAAGQQVTLSVAADIVNAPVGTLSSGISIVSSDSGILLADQKVKVSVQITAQLPVLTMTPGNLTFNQSTNNPLVAQTITLTNSSTTALHWSLAQPTASLQTWLTLSAATGSLEPGATATVSVSCTSTTLTAGSYTASLQLFNTDLSATTVVQTVTVTLVVS